MRLRRVAVVVALAVAVCGCDAMATPIPTTLGAAVGPVPTIAPSPAGVLDQDDGETVGNDGPLPTPASGIDPTAAATGRLPGEPDPTLTPGAFNPAVTQATIGSTICVSGWTATVRPPSSYTTTLKIEQIAQYGYHDTKTADYEEDHLVPLELGGAPSDARNLWPEPYTATLPDGRPVGARVKDQLENALKAAVCSGTLSLAAARAEIGVHWVHTYYGIPVASGGGTTPPATPGPSTARVTVSRVSLTASVGRGATASVSVKTAASARCTIVVTYNSGPSKASGLVPKTASSAGRVSWSWKVGTRTALGRYPITISCTKGGRTGSLTLSFTVT